MRQRGSGKRGGKLRRRAPTSLRPPPRAWLWCAVGVLSSPAYLGAQTCDPGAPTTGPERLETVEVTSDRLQVETRIDRKIYSVTEDAQSAFGTASDVLNNIPSIDVDDSGSVSLRGDSNVVILIDGKPSTKFQGSAAGENLQALSAANIERIEVLTTPPPELKAEGAAGVINIVTRTRQGAGVAGSLQSSLGSEGRDVMGAAISQGGASGSASLNAGFRHDLRQRRVDSEVSGPDPATGAVLTSHSGFSERQDRQVPTVGISLERMLNERQSVSAAASWGERGGLRTYDQRNGTINGSGVEVASSGRVSSGHDPETDVNASLQFTQKLARPGESLALSVNRSRSRQREQYDYTNESFVPQAPDSHSGLAFAEDQSVTGAQFDYALPFDKSRTIKVGYAFESTEYTYVSSGTTVDPGTGAVLVDPRQTDDYRYRQRVHGVYGSYQTGIDQWTVLGGMRAEWTTNDGRALSTGSETDQRYAKLFPNVHIDYAITDSATLSLGYSRRISRPHPDALDPYINREDEPNLSGGNPNLRPQLTKSLDLGFGVEKRDLTYQTTAYYRHNSDSVTDVIENLGNGVTLATKANLPRNDAAGVEFSASGRPRRWFSYHVSGNAFYSEVDATALGTPGLRSSTGINVKAKVDFRPTARDSLQISALRTDKRLTAQGTVSAINLVNAGYRRTVSRAWSLVLTCSDLFNGQRFERDISTADLTQTYTRTVAGRITFLGFIYAFGTGKRDKAPSFEYDQGG